MDYLNRFYFQRTIERCLFMSVTLFSLTHGRNEMTSRKILIYMESTCSHFDRVVVNGISTRLGLCYTCRLANRVHCRFVFTFLVTCNTMAANTIWCNVASKKQQQILEQTLQQNRNKWVQTPVALLRSFFGQIPLRKVWTPLSSQPWVK